MTDNTKDERPEPLNAGTPPAGDAPAQPQAPKNEPVETPEAPEESDAHDDAA